MNPFILLCIVHLLGDFTLQPYKLLKKKENSIYYLLLHSVIYTVLVLLVFLCFGNLLQIIFFSIAIFITHFGIDLLKIKLDKKFNNIKFSYWGYIIDQIIHIGLLFTLSLFMDNFNNIGEWSIMALYNYLNMTITIERAMKIILAITIVLTPASVFIKHFFNFTFKKNQDNANICEEDTNIYEEENKVGSVIGKVERLIVLILGLMGLYTSIAIVLTAKSIARFKQLDKKDFAEKYLVGTLISILIAILCIVMVNI